MALCLLRCLNVPLCRVPAGLEEELLSLYLGISQEHGYRFPRLESGGDCMAWDQAASYDLHMRTQGF